MEVLTWASVIRQDTAFCTLPSWEFIPNGFDCVCQPHPVQEMRSCFLLVKWSFPGRVCNNLQHGVSINWKESIGDYFGSSFSFTYWFALVLTFILISLSSHSPYLSFSTTQTVDFYLCFFSRQTLVFSGILLWSSSVQVGNHNKTISLLSFTFNVILGALRTSLCDRIVALPPKLDRVELSQTNSKCSCKARGLRYMSALWCLCEKYKEIDAIMYLWFLASLPGQIFLLYLRKISKPIFCCQTMSLASCPSAMEPSEVIK